MAIIQIEFACKCDKCGYIWLPKNINNPNKKAKWPTWCAKCKSPLWNSNNSNNIKKPLLGMLKINNLL